MTVDVQESAERAVVGSASLVAERGEASGSCVDKARRCVCGLAGVCSHRGYDRRNVSSETENVVHVHAAALRSAMTVRGQLIEARLEQAQAIRFLHVLACVGRYGPSELRSMRSVTIDSPMSHHCVGVGVTNG